MQYGPHLRYLLRIFLLLAALLALWWTLLLTPLLGILRLSTELVFRVCLPASPPARVEIQPNGDWHFRVPIPAALARRDEIQRMFGRTSKDAPLVTVRSLQLQVAGGYPSLFTVSVPFFWALVLSIRWTRRTAKTLAAGTGILVVVSVLLAVFEVIRVFLESTHLLAAGGLSSALVHAGDFAALNVIPYLAPVVLALLLGRDLQSMIFGLGASPAVASRPKPKTFAKTAPVAGAAPKAARR
jgi:hypothetical protein